MLKSVQCVDVAADNLSHVLRLHVLVCVVRYTSFHCWRRLQRHGVLLKVWIITVHVLLEFKQAVTRLALTLHESAGA